MHHSLSRCRSAIELAWPCGAPTRHACGGALPSRQEVKKELDAERRPVALTQPSSASTPRGPRPIQHTKARTIARWSSPIHPLPTKLSEVPRARLVVAPRTPRMKRDSARTEHRPP